MSTNLENQIKTRLPPKATYGGWHRWVIRTVAVILVMLLSASASFAYSVLTHEEIVDLVWSHELRPLLRFKSINTTVDQYRIYLHQVRAGSLELANTDFDTGKETKAAEYSLTDETYAKLLGQLAGRRFALTSPDLRDNILSFYSDLSAPIETKKDVARWQSVLSSLDQLKLVAPTPILAASPVLQH